MITSMSSRTPVTAHVLARALTSFQAKALSALMPSPEAVAIAEKDVDLEHIEDPIMRKDMLKKLDARNAPRDGVLQPLFHQGTRRHTSRIPTSSSTMWA